MECTEGCKESDTTERLSLSSAEDAGSDQVRSLVRELRPHMRGGS